MTIQETLSQYLVQAAPVIGTLLLAVITALSARAVSWVNAHTKNTLVNGFMARLSTEVYAGVSAIEQTVVEQLKKSNGGVLTAADAAAVKKSAVDLVLANLGGDKWLAEAKKILGETDIEAFLASRIEAAVNEMGKSAPVVKVQAPPTPVQVAAS